MQLVSIVGKQYLITVELDDGSVRSGYLTAAEYAEINDAIAQGKVPANIRNRVVRWWAGECDLFDTASGLLEEDQYAVRDGGGYWVRPVGKPVGEVDDTGMNGDLLIKTPDYGYSV